MWLPEESRRRSLGLEVAPLAACPSPDPRSSKQRKQAENGLQRITGFGLESVDVSEVGKWDH